MKTLELQSQDIPKIKVHQCKNDENFKIYFREHAYDEFGNDAEVIFEDDNTIRTMFWISSVDMICFTEDLNKLIDRYRI